MNAHIESQERREVLNVARRYRRDGYKVSGPDKRATMPAFLGDLVPDLIAERDDDKVVIEVKRAKAVRGANDIVDLAERVAAQPGWRFELIAVPELTKISTPDLGQVGHEIRRLVGRGFLKPAYIVAYAVIENLLAVAAARQNRNPANLAFPALVRDLVVRGIIDDDVRHQVEEARKARNAISHGTDEPRVTRSEVDALLKLGAELQREISAVDA